MIWVVAAGVAAFALVPRDDPARRAVSGKAVSSVAPGVDEEQLARANKKTFLVRGMVCQSCVETVTEALLGVPGVLAADVSLEGGRAVVSTDPNAVPADTALVNTVLRAGYKLWPTPDGDSGENEGVKENDD
jgi:copper chaperone CopZ